MMLRQRKRDINLKPNRVLDKKGSRGMLYENEDLRLRTIHINDEVERGHNDIKKLKKENDHLKREIWTLRDNYDELEKMLQKVIVNTTVGVVSGNIGGNSSMSPEHMANNELLMANAQAAFDKFKEELVRQEQQGAGGYDYYTGEYNYEQEDDSYYDGDQDGCSFDSCSLASYTNPQDPPLSQNLNVSQEIGENSPSTSSAGLLRAPSFHQQPPFVLDLEVVKEESEVASTTNISQNSGNSDNSSSTATVIPNYNSDVISDIGFESIAKEVVGKDTGNTITTTTSTSTSIKDSEDPKNPKIEITPAVIKTGATDTEADNDKVVNIPAEAAAEVQEFGPKPESTPNENKSEVLVQDLGCVTELAQKYKVISQLVNVNSHESNYDSTEENTTCGEQTPPNGTTTSNLAEKRCPSPMVVSKRKRFASKLLKNNKYRHSTGPTCIRLQGQEINLQIQPDTRQCGSGGKCKSEPNYLNLLGQYGGVSDDEEINLILKRIRKMLLTTNCTTLDDQFSSVSKSSLRSSNCWSSIDQNILIGVCQDGHGEGKFESELTAQEVIDELESQFNPNLELITGVRIISPGHKIFISLANSSSVCRFLEKSSNSSPLTLRGVKYAFEEGVKSFSTVLLTHIPPELRDSAVITVLNQYGQVVSPLERKNYKGIDISERIVKMHIISHIPSTLSIGGFLIKVAVHGEPKSLGQKILNSTPPEYDRVQFFSSSNSKPNTPLLGSSKNPHKPPIPPRTVSNPGSPSQSPVPGPISNTISPLPSPHVTPRPLHRPVTKAVSSMPRLEQQNNAQNGHPYQRQMSVCGPHVNIASNSPQNQNLLQPEKKPIIRSPLQRCSTVSGAQHLNNNNLLNDKNANDKNFSRSLSLNPRLRGQPIKAGQDMKEDMRQLRRSASQNTQNTDDMSKIGKSDSLPWFSCWGNGCI